MSEQKDKGREALRAAEPTPLCLVGGGEPASLASLREYAHHVVNEMFDKTLKRGNRADGVMLVVVEKDPQLVTRFECDGRWRQTSDMMAALVITQSEVMNFFKTGKGFES